VYTTGVQFYNFPYTFGYLFALGVYAQQEAKGAGFHEAYVNLLRDTGRMSAEEVLQKHFYEGYIKALVRLISKALS